MAPAALAAVGVVLLLYTLSAFRALPRLLNESRQCRMSFMKPVFISHTDELKKVASHDAPPLHRFKLYQYRESGLPIHSGTFGKNGAAVPVLFVPGNAGAYGQVRSLASSAATQYWENDEPFPEFQHSRGPIEWWTLELNEGFSAFSGRILEDQAWYINEAVRYLRSLYAVPGDTRYMLGERNFTVSLLGHSMGGASARLALQMPNHDPGSVDTIVTLATPHAFPPLSIDRDLENVYKKMNAPVKGIPPLIVSLAGGVLDAQVSSDASSLSLGRLHDPDARLSSYSSTVENLWSTIDHVGMVWCDQLRTRIARAFLLDLLVFDMIAEPRRQPHVLQQRRTLWRNVLGLPLEAASPREQHAVLFSGPSTFAMMDVLTKPQVVPLAGENGIYNDKNGSIITHVLSPPGPNHRYDIDQSVADDDERLAFEVITNLAVGPSHTSRLSVLEPFELFVLACKTAPKMDDPSENTLCQCSMVLPHMFSLLPRSPRDAALHAGTERFPDALKFYDSQKRSLRRLRISSAFIKEHGIEFFRLDKRVDTSSAAAEHGNVTILHPGWVPERRHVLHGGPHWWSSKSWSLHQPQTLADSTRRVLWEWLAKDIDSSLLAYNLELVAAKCTGTRDTGSIDFAPILRATNLATGDSRIYPALPLAGTRQPLMLHGSAPFMPPASMWHRGTLFQLWVPEGFDDTCPLPYDVLRLTVNTRASIGLLVMRYRMALITWPLAVLALAFVLSPTQSPIAALLSLAQPRGIGLLASVPAAIHVAAAVANAVGLGVRWHTVGVGIVDLRFIMVGPFLALVSYALALVVTMVVEGLIAALVRLVRPVSQAVTFSRLVVLGAGITFVLACALWPYQLLSMCGVAVYLCLTVLHAADSRHASPDAPVHALQRVRMWYSVMFVLVLPLLIPPVVAWGRSGAGVWGESVIGIAVRVYMCAGPALLSVAHMHPMPDNPQWIGSVTRAGFGALGAAVAFYGARFAFVAYDMLVLLVYWELVQRYIPRKSTEEHDVLLEPIAAYLDVPRELEPPVPPSVAKSVSPTEKDSAQQNTTTGAAPDKLLLEYLDTLDAYTAMRNSAGTSLSSAYQQLARAKVILGAHLGRDTYDERMVAQVHVSPELEIVRGPPPAKSDAPSAATGLRRRNGAEKEDAPETEHTRESRAPSGYDPLLQFSGLPPPSLRNAQRHFSEALDHLARSGGVLALQTKLLALEEAIRAARNVE